MSIVIMRSLIENYENCYLLTARKCSVVENDADNTVDDDDHSLSIDGNLIFIQ